MFEESDFQEGWNDGYNGLLDPDAGRSAAYKQGWLFGLAERQQDEEAE